MSTSSTSIGQRPRLSPGSVDEANIQCLDPLSTGTPRNSKIAIACEECRRRKQRCDGQIPCRICTKRRARCFYRNNPRQTTAWSAPVTSDQHVTSTPQDVAGGAFSPVMPPRVQIFNNICATNAATGTQVFYGASSNFSMLQHLHMHIPLQAAADINRESHGHEAADGSEGIERYNYQTIVFDDMPPPSQYAPQNNSLSPILARACLRSYLITLGHLMSFLGPDELCSTLEDLYVPGSSVGVCERAVIITAMALGAMSLPDDSLKQDVLVQARAASEQIIHKTSLRSVQAALLLSRCEFQAGNANTAYLHLGSAIRKAFAVGIHRGTSLEAKRTIAVLYCDESIICFILGRPYTLSETEITASMPEESSYLGSLVRLCAIIRSTYRLYHIEARSLATDLALANSIHQQLCMFAAKMKTELGIELGGEIYTLTGEKLFWHITLSYLYRLTALTLFRPFFLLHAELKRRQKVNETFPVNSVNELQILKACTECIDSAHSIVLLCSSLSSLNIGLEESYHHGFYLENASFILVLAAVYDDRKPSPFLELTEVGLKLLQNLSQRGPVRSVVAALEQMMARVTTLSTCNPSNGAHGAEIGGGGLEQTQPHYPLGSIDSHDQLEPSARLSSSVLDPMAANTMVPDESGEILGGLWSIMDWDLTFPLLDVEPYIQE